MTGRDDLWWSGRMVTCDFVTHRVWNSDEVGPVTEEPCTHTEAERAAVAKLQLRPKHPRALVDLPPSRSLKARMRRFIARG